MEKKEITGYTNLIKERFDTGWNIYEKQNGAKCNSFSMCFLKFFKWIILIHNSLIFSMNLEKPNSMKSKSKC